MPVPPRASESLSRACYADEQSRSYLPCVLVILVPKRSLNVESVVVAVHRHAHALAISAWVPCLDRSLSMDEEGDERRAKQFPNSPPVTVYFTNVYP